MIVSLLSDHAVVSDEVLSHFHELLDLFLCILGRLVLRANLVKFSKGTFFSPAGAFLSHLLLIDVFLDHLAVVAAAVSLAAAGGTYVGSRRQ